ncbi:MAG: efflux RND transporter permease subunit [Woeseiaceae bacterium]
MNLAELSIRNKVLSVIVILLSVMFGWSAYTDMARFEDPEFTIRTAQVFVQYPGASPREVAEEVTDVLEREIQQMQEVEEVRSISSAGSAVLMVDILYEFSPSKPDLEVLWTKLRNRVADAERSLPPGASKPVVNDDFGDVFGLYYFLTGEGYSPAEIRRYAKELQGDILQVDGVAKVMFDGERSEAIFVEISRENALALGVSVNQVYNTLAQQNSVVSAGDTTVGGQVLLIEPTGAIDSVEAIRNLLVASGSDGRIVYLGDVAEVWRGYRKPTKMYRYNGVPALALGVSARLGDNIVKIGKAVDEKIAEGESRRPIGIELHEFYHQGDIVDASVQDFVANVIAALVIVLVTLLVFMGLKPAIVIGAVLLLTIFATLAFMEIFSIPMHRISLGALIIALGMMVDNAIVVTEGILVGVKRGADKLEIAKKIVSQTQWPLLGGTLVGIIAFAPIGFAPGSTAEYTGHLFWVVLISLGFSWIFAITLTPLFCFWLFEQAETAEGDDDQAESKFLQVYQRVLGLALRMRIVVVAGVVGLFLTSLWGLQFVKEGFFPSSTLPIFVVDFFLTEGTDIYKTEQEIVKIEEFVAGLEGVDSINTSIGGSNLRYMLVYSTEPANTSFGRLLVRADDAGVIEGLMQDIQAYIDNNYPTAQGKVWRFRLGPGGGSSIEATFKGPDPAVLRSLADEANRIMAADGGAMLIKTDWRQLTPVIEPLYSAAKGRRAGVSREELADALRTVYSGKTVGFYREGDDLVPIISRAPVVEREDVVDMRNVQVLSAVTGITVPIGQITDGFRTTWRDGILRREDRVWALKAQCDPYPDELPSQLLDRIRPAIEAIELPDGYSLEWDGEYGDAKEANDNLAETLPLGFLAMVLTVFVLFGSVRQPVVIWLVVPLALIGVVFGLVITGLPLEFMAILGLLSLSGLLIKNAIVLVDQIDLEIASGKPRLDAVIDASSSRVRPVTMGALTTALGVMMLFLDAFFESMAVVMVFGLSFATILTLIVVPVLYAMFFRIKVDEVSHEVA